MGVENCLAACLMRGPARIVRGHHLGSTDLVKKYRTLPFFLWNNTFGIFLKSDRLTLFRSLLPPTLSSHLKLGRTSVMKAKAKFAISGVIVLGAAAAVVALAPAPQARDASRVIPSLTLPQQPSDRVPAAVFSILDKDLNIDPAQTRRLGSVGTVTYYAAAPGDKICMIPVDSTGKDNGFIGCTLLDSIESAGLKFENAERTEAVWLVVPSTADKSLDEVKNEPGWTKQASNFLVRTK
ncbi:hypothetical protein [Arthrobacter silvisoli]|uniref:hypothetical protein n=1 Tax=Arthrobacter silvisoli TaxID=2291022 RepID=UPI001FE4BBEA|nr:hypothetical protein [Arthrobacter silvisoli]